MKLIPVLVGGFGNRLYQIANAIRLSKLYNFDLEFYRINPTDKDVERFRHLILRPSDLDDFGGHTLVAPKNLPNTINDIFPTLNISSNQVEINTLFNGKNLFFEYEISQLRPIRDTIVMGYYFSYSYVKNEIEDVRNLFNPLIDQYVVSKYPKLNTENVLGIHFRLGINSDNSPAVNVSIDFYNRIIAKEYNNFDSIFIVSDNIEKSKSIISNLNYGNKKIYFNESEPMYVDLWILSKCSTLIIAPSTLSAWSAYLNKNKNVYVPKIWPQHHWTQDLPTEWKLY